MLRSLAALGVVLSLGLACKTDPPPQGEGGEDDSATKKNPEEVDAQRRENHQAAFQALVPATTDALVLANPTAASSVGIGDLRPRPTSLGERERLNDAFKGASRESGDIDGGLLEPREQIVLRTMRFALDRMNDQLSRQLPARTDATYTPWGLGELIDEVEYRALQGDCAGCPEAIETLGPALHSVAADLTATSPAGIEAGMEDLDALVVRLERLEQRVTEPEPMHAATQGAIAAARETRTKLAEIRDGLGDAPEHAWLDRPPLRQKGERIRRLPNRLGGRALVRRLEVEEALPVPLEGLLDAVKKNLARYKGMREPFADAVGTAGKAAPVDAARCQATWERIQDKVLRQTGGFEDLTVDCEALARVSRGENLDDAQLLLRVTDLAVVEPVRRGFRASQDPAISLTTGRWAPSAQRSIRRVMLLTPLADAAVMTRILDDGERDLCLAATALWIHGEMGDDETLTSWLDLHCKLHKPEEWIAQAEARPRQSLTGLGLASLTEQPASMVGIDMFYWAPLGVIPLLATPPESMGGPEPAEGMAEGGLPPGIDPSAVPGQSGTPPGAPQEPEESNIRIHVQELGD